LTTSIARQKFDAVLIASAKTSNFFLEPMKPRLCMNACSLLGHLPERGQISLNIRILRLQLRQCFDMRQRGGKILGFDLVGGQRRKAVAIIGLPREGAFQNIDRRLGLAGVMQRDGVDIGVAGIVGRKFAGPAQFGERLGVVLLTHEGQPERVARVGIVRIQRQRLLGA